MKDTMLFDNRSEALAHILLGASGGVMAYLFLSWLTQPGAIFGAPMGFDFTFCFNGNVPEALGAALGFLLWGLFGAEAGVAMLPFADEGEDLIRRSLIHFLVMGLTLWAWVLLNFSPEPWGGLALTFLLPYGLVYALVWLGRWVGWYAEVGQIRVRLGLAPGPSFLKWKETMPHVAFAGLLCLVVPLILRLCDATDVPVLSGLFYPYLLLPLGGFISAVSLGKRQGFCPLYPLSAVGFILLFVLLARLGPGMDGTWLPIAVNDQTLLPVALLATLFGNALGAKHRARRSIVE